MKKHDNNNKFTAINNFIMIIIYRPLEKCYFFLILASLTKIVSKTNQLKFTSMHIKYSFHNGN